LKTLESVFEAFSELKVLIIGDVMVDAYDWGRVERISPEAPVPIINIQNRENRLGGAANVALNIQALGATPILCAVIGDDLDGLELKNLLLTANMSTDGIVISKERLTTVKRRVIAGSQHLLRIDTETDKVLSNTEETNLINKIKAIIPKVDVVIFEDYDKGVITENIIKEVVAICQKHNIPTTVDPKKRNFLNYKNVNLFKPNLKELKEGLKIDLKQATIDEINKAVLQLDTILLAQKYLITLSEKGVLFHQGGNHIHINAHVREIADVSGAGDTVISVASLCLALGLPNQVLAELANLSGGLVCEHVGVVPINKKDLLVEAKKMDLEKYL
jgi:rfaE bifunctional protein kinase chain/domain